MNPYAHVAAAKLKRDKQSYEAFRAVDQQLHDQAHKARTEKALALAAEDLDCWREDHAEVSVDAAQALAEARDAEDRAMAAATFAEEAASAHRKIRDTGSPREVTEALTAAQNATRVAGERGQRAEETATRRENVNELLAASREQLALAEIRHSQALRSG